jgi:tRNA modification GTPase
LLNKERALVSSIAGTTRDVISESIIMGGIQFNIHDTAGIRESADEIERAGVALSEKSLGEASFALAVIDAIDGIDEYDQKILRALEGKKSIVLINKTDAAGEEKIRALENNFKGAVRFSAKTGYGLAELEKRIIDIFKNEFVTLKDSFIASVRVINLLEDSLFGMERVVGSFGSEYEITAFELQQVMDKLGEITGEISPDDVLDSIFSRFCVGK